MDVSVGERSNIGDAEVFTYIVDDESLRLLCNPKVSKPSLPPNGDFATIECFPFSESLTPDWLTLTGAGGNFNDEIVCSCKHF